MKRKWKFWLAIIALICIVGSCSNVTDKTEKTNPTGTVENESYYNKEETHSKTEDIVTGRAPENDVSNEDSSSISEPEPLPGSTEATPPETAEIPEDDVLEELEVHFLDVGQGDATLIKCGSSAMLIDTSTDDKGTAIQNYLKKQDVSKLEYLILTHPDADHIGSADVIITKFDIDNVFMSDFTKDNKTYNGVLDALKYKNLKWKTPEVGSEYSLSDATFRIIGPVKKYDEPNNSSIAIILTHGSNTFLFTGDAEEDAEKDLVNSGYLKDIDVYHVGHHGSKSSSSTSFMDVILPQWAVISCGENNSYGHPHAQTLNTLRGMGISVYRTDEQGTVIAYSDGTDITWNMSPSDTWKAGEPTGSSESKDKNTSAEEDKSKQETKPTEFQYIGNKNNKKLHKATCRTLPKENNRDYFYTKDDAAAAGYTDPCGNCKP